VLLPAIQLHSNTITASHKQVFIFILFLMKFILVHFLCEFSGKTSSNLKDHQ